MLKSPGYPQSQGWQSLGHPILAPHSASQTRESAEMTAEVCVDCILAVARGESPNADYVLNPEAEGA